MYFVDSGIKQKKKKKKFLLLYLFLYGFQGNTFDVCFIPRKFIKISFILALRFHGFHFNTAFNQIDEV